MRGETAPIYFGTWKSSTTFGIYDSEYRANAL